MQGGARAGGNAVHTRAGGEQGAHVHAHAMRGFSLTVVCVCAEGKQTHGRAHVRAAVARNTSGVSH